MTGSRRFAIDKAMLRRCSSSTFSYWCNLTALFLVWIFCPMENRFFLFIRKNKASLFPHVDFTRLKPLDPLRIFIQTLFILVILPPAQRRPLCPTWIKKLYSRIARSRSWLGEQYGRDSQTAIGGFFSELSQKERTDPINVLLAILVSISFVAVMICITQPLEVRYQWVFLSVLFAIALFCRSMQSHFALLILIILSLVVSSRYFFWRITETIYISTFWATTFCFILLLAEIYTFIIMVLGYLQLSWGLDRKPYPMPRDASEWPSVDIYIPTYNEPLSIVKPTVFSAQALDWPKEKLNVYILDDGSRPEFEAFCKEAGCGYIKRLEHNHAKAGNINHAMTKTDGELIAIFDCDHVPVRAFLQLTVGWLVADKKIAFVQTPHHFYSDDPFIKNLGLDESIASENSLFHNFIQKGNDMWNATMFCGSCAVFRRSALEEVGGIAVETVTEDAHTSLKLAARGWKSAFISIPLAAGLATESLSSHIGQRMRWARGMVQIFRINCPLFMRGLTFNQRICYLNGSFYFLHGIPKIIFLLAPLPFLFANMYVIYASGLAILSYVLPHLLHSAMTTQAIQYRNRNPFWSGVYDAVLSFYIVLPTTVALMVPEFGKFNVTQKGGGIVEKNFLDGAISRPYMILMAANFFGMLYGLIQMPFSNPSMQSALAINCLWAFYNLLILGAAVGVAVESRQVRASPRVRMEVPLYLTKGQNLLVAGEMVDFSQGGVGVRLEAGTDSGGFFKEGDHVTLSIPYDGTNFNFTGSVRRVDKTGFVGILLDEMDMDCERHFYACTFSRSDTWTKKGRDEINQTFVSNFLQICTISAQGFRSIVQFAPAPIRLPVQALIRFFLFIVSFLPHAFRVKPTLAAAPSSRRPPNA